MVRIYKFGRINTENIENANINIHFVKETEQYA